MYRVELCSCGGAGAEYTAMYVLGLTRAMYVLHVLVYTQTAQPSQCHTAHTKRHQHQRSILAGSRLFTSCLLVELCFVCCVLWCVNIS